MKVLKAIGRFFAKIGRWIADTAWIQPLLIVGGIFALIFSISPIANWVGSWFSSGDSAEVYYQKYELSWSGVEKTAANSEVDKIFKYIENPDDAQYASYAKKYGKKFFLSFVIADCPDCKSNYYGLKTAQANWGKGEFAFASDDDYEDFKIASIYVDDKNDDDELYFSHYISGNENTCRYTDFFELASTLDNPYIKNIKADETYYDALFDYNNEFTTPTLMLIDLTEKANTTAPWTNVFGVSEIIFKYEGRDGGTSNYDLARTVWDCWNHEGKFSSDYKA